MQAKGFSLAEAMYFLIVSIDALPIELIKYPSDQNVFPSKIHGEAD